MSEVGGGSFLFYLGGRRCWWERSRWESRGFVWVGFLRMGVWIFGSCMSRGSRGRSFSIWNSMCKDIIVRKSLRG